MLQHFQLNKFFPVSLPKVLKIRYTLMDYYSVDVHYIALKVSLLGVDSLWGDCLFIPADWGS